MAAARKIARKFARLPEKKLFCPTLGGCSPPAPSPSSYAYEHLHRLTLLSQVDLAVNVGLRGWGANSWTMDPSGLRPRARVVANLSNTGYICRQWVSEWVSEFGNGAVWVAIIMQDFHRTIWVRPHSSSGSQMRAAEDSNYAERCMLPMPNLWTNMCVENWSVLPLSHASTLTTIRDPSCRRPSPTSVNLYSA